ncbi:MAG: extracellular solute-binding protein [Candidatus Omnitrophota bacterium]
MVLRKLIAVFVVVVFALCGAGCGGNVSDKKQLIVWHVGPESQAQTIMKLSEKFTEETGIEVVCQALSWGDAHSKYLTSIAGEVSPDIGSMGLTWGMEFGELGAMVDLRKEYPEDVARLQANIFPGILRSTQIGDKVYGIPFDISEHILYYRTDMIPVPPGTWDELLAMVKDLKSRGKGMVIDWGSLDWIGYSPFLWQAGGDYYSEDLSRPTLDTPAAAEALAFLGQLYKEGVPKTAVPLEQGMRTGDYPLAISGNWKIVSLTVGAPEIKDKWSIAMLPRGPSGKSTAFIGGRIMSIFSRSKKKDEAWEFIKFLFKPENQIKIYETSLETEDAYLPPNMKTWEKLPMKAEFKDILEAQANDAKGPPPVLSWDASTRFVNQAIQMVILKNSDPAEELKKANAEMQKEMNRKR